MALFTWQSCFRDHDFLLVMIVLDWVAAGEVWRGLSQPRPMTGVKAWHSPSVAYWLADPWGATAVPPWSIPQKRNLTAKAL